MASSEAAVFIQIDENPNCAAWDGQVYKSRTPPRELTHVCCDRDGNQVWCAITGLDEENQLTPAMACIVDDSGDGSCYLIFGGSWGLRLTDESNVSWGVPFMLLPSDGANLRFR